MKNRIALSLLAATAVMLCLEGCKTSQGNAEAAQLPKRSALDYDVYGGLISLTTIDDLTCSGELIGMRNDSVIVLSETTGIHSIYHKNIAIANVKVYNPDSYNGAFAMIAPNLLLLIHLPAFEGGPLVLSMLLSAIDLAGIGIAKKVEKKKLNYYDRSDGWKEVSKYSRFPAGIPPHLVLSDIKGR